MLVKIRPMRPKDGGVLLSKNPDFGDLGMLGIYSAWRSIFGIFDSSRSEITHEIGKFGDFCHISGGYLSVLADFGVRTSLVSDVVRD